MDQEQRAPHGRDGANFSAKWAPGRSRAVAISAYALIFTLALIGFGLTVLVLEAESAVRAYVAGESQWSKAQKEAVYRLERFAANGETSDLKAARQALEVPLADLRARRAMEQNPPDRDAAIRYLVKGRNHPDDAPRMVRLYLHLHDAPYVRDAMDYWRDSDPYIRRLAAIADEIEAHVEAAHTGGIMLALREEVGQIARELRPLQDGFSDALGERSRFAARWLRGSAAAIFGALAFFTAATFRWAIRRIADSEKKFRDTFEQAAMGMAQMRPDGTLLAVNNAFCDLLRYSRNDLVGSHLSEFLHPEQDPASLHRLLAGVDAPNTHEYQFTTRSGAPVWCKLSPSRVDPTGNGRNHLILGVEDVTEARELMHKLHYQARHDALTGTINRHEFEERLAQALRDARDNGVQHALCFIDLDQFKVVNDTCGHLSGDEVLQDVTRLLQRELRRTDILARLGGDEFGVILRDCDQTAAIEVAEKLREVIGDYVFTSDEVMLRLGASIGCVPIDGAAVDGEDLLRAADTACYLAKDYGRNRVVPYSPEDHGLQLRHSEMASLTRIRAALSAERFVLYAQGMRSVGDVEPARFEILLRMLDPAGNEVAPDRFLPAAERYQIAPEIDRWVVEETLRTLARHPQQLESLGACHINLSGQSIGREDFLGFLEETLDRSPVDPRKLCFEITETAAITNPADAGHFFRRLHQRGCGFALDDFGTGLSSFGYLTNMPVDMIKVDGTFVRDALENKTHQAIVKAIGEISAIMGKGAVAEYVETDAAATRMAELGIGWLQGYAIHRPCPLEEFLRALDQERQATGT